MAIITKHLPFSAPRRRSLPTVNTQDIAGTLENWKNKLTPVVKNSLPAPTPYNFAVTSSRGGLQLNWSPVQTPADTALGSPDGYEILKSPNGSFTDDLQIISIRGANQSSYFDSTNGNALTCHYRIRTTSGTASNPQSMRGPESGTVAHTSIDSNDTNTVPTTIFDNFTTSKTRSNARLGNYGPQSAFKTALGTSGGSSSGAGTTAGSGVNPPNPASSGSGAAVTFDQIGTGVNISAQMIVSGSSEIIPDPDDPGIIDATEIQGIPVDPSPPTHNGELLIYDSASGTYIPGDPLVQGVESIGTVSTTNPVQIGGIDSTGRVQKLAVDPDGGLPDIKQTNRLLLNMLLVLQQIAIALNAEPTNTL